LRGYAQTEENSLEAISEAATKTYDVISVDDLVNDDKKFNINNNVTEPDFDDGEGEGEDKEGDKRREEEEKKKKEEEEKKRKQEEEQKRK